MFDILLSMEEVRLTEVVISMEVVSIDCCLKLRNDTSFLGGSEGRGFSKKFLFLPYTSMGLCCGCGIVVVGCVDWGGDGMKMKSRGRRILPK